jgi:membrane protease YdiL (CAAX protease family)
VDASSRSVAGGNVRIRARRGLVVFFAVLVPLSVTFQAITIATGNASWILALMWSPAAASVVARLVLREGFADVSFRFGGRRTWKYLALAPIFPIVVGLIAYAIAWTTGVARFAPQPLGLVAPLVGDGASPLTVFLVTLALAATVGTVFVVPYAAGEEIGWRGYMLTRLIDAGVPRPILASGVIWGLWHVPLILAGMYVAGSSPVVAALLFMVAATSFCFVIGRMRLETGSIWPAIALHAAWNSIIQSAFGAATKGAGAALWAGEAGIFTALALVVAAVIFSRGRWRVRKAPETPRRGAGTPKSRPAPQT